MESSTLTRRDFFKVSAAVGGGLLLEFTIGQGTNPAEAATAPALNAWLRIDPDGTVTVQVASSEMGQGVMTAIPMLVAEELDADWRLLRSQHAPADRAYFNPLFGRQATGGSTAVRGFHDVVRKAGAAAREMLVTAAAKSWGVKPDDCRTENSVVTHPTSGRSRRYGELAAEAARLPAPSPELVSLKDPGRYRLVGQPLSRLDTPAKVDGSGLFAPDVHRPEMLYAVIARSPVFGGRVKKFDAAAARRVKGVRDVIPIEAGVAVLADHTWAALRGRDALGIEWEEGAAANLSSATIRTQFEAALDRGATVRQEGEAGQALRRGRTIEAVYEVPYLAHACMEPMNCTAHVRRDGVDVWVGTQGQSATQATAARIAGVSPAQVRVHTQFLGGGFGRRGEQDFVIEAVELSKRAGRPVQVFWTREDDTRHDFYRPATLNRLTAVLDRNGRPHAWRHRIAGPSILARVFPDRLKDGRDFSSIEGAANLPYAIPHIEVSYAMVNTAVPVGFWRSVGSSQNAFITECFLDELAAAGKQDPYQLRHRLLAGHPRHRGTLELAAGRAGWGKPLPRGRARGIAVAESFGSYVTQVAEVSVEGGRLRVHRVVCAIDCGRIVNPGIIEAQMESGIVYGLTAALKGEITIDRGRVVQGNFNDYPMLTLAEMPAVEVHIVKSNQPPGGVGEPGTPPIAPAVANAVFAATRRPVRKLPIRL